VSRPTLWSRLEPCGKKGGGKIPQDPKRKGRVFFFSGKEKSVEPETAEGKKAFVHEKRGKSPRQRGTTRKRGVHRPTGKGVPRVKGNRVRTTRKQKKNPYKWEERKGIVTVEGKGGIIPLGKKRVEFCLEKKKGEKRMRRKWRREKALSPRGQGRGEFQEKGKKKLSSHRCKRFVRGNFFTPSKLAMEKTGVTIRERKKELSSSRNFCSSLGKERTILGERIRGRGKERGTTENNKHRGNGDLI